MFRPIGTFLCYSLKGYGHDFSWNISNFVCIFLRSNVVNLNIVLCLNIIFRSKRVTSKIQSWLILCNVNKIHMPCFCLWEPIKISLYLFFSIFWNINMIYTNSFEIFFISFKKNWNTGFPFFFQCIISKQKHETKLENFQLKIETIYLEIYTSEMDFLNSTVYYMYYYLDSTAILNFFHIWSAAVTIQYTSLLCSW